MPERATPTSPLLNRTGSKGKDRDPDHDEEVDAASETTPLISNATPTPRYDGEADDDDVEQSPFPTGSDPDVPIPDEFLDDDTPSKSKTRWPSIIAVTLLTLSCIFIIFAGFVIPDRVKQYAERALVVEPTDLSLEAITQQGVRVRVQAVFHLDGSRVQDQTTRRIGRAVTSIVREIGIDETTVSVYLPDFGGALAGTAALPPLTVSVVDGQSTHLDIVTDLAAGDVEAIRSLANQWLGGKLDTLRVLGKAKIPVRSGRIPLGKHSVSEPLVFEGRDLYRSFASLYLGEKTFFF